MKEQLFGLEANFENLNGIDFKKGCYVGQENTARMKLKEKISRRIYPVEIIEGKISLDDVIITMWKTGQDMLNKYKETAEGGLALQIPVNQPEC